MMKPHAAFAKRLTLACAKSRCVPAAGQGRQTYIAHHLKVSQEAVRRWFSGDSLPRPLRMAMLANLLTCELSWLSLGVTPELPVREPKKFKRVAEGGVHYVAGLYLIAGYNIAWADPGVDGFDFYAIRAGEHVAVSVTTGRSAGDELLIPARPTYAKSTNVAVLPRSGGRVDAVFLDQAGIRENGIDTGGVVQLRARKLKERYMTGEHAWTPFSEAM